jgi:Rrf2 family protein
MLNLYIVEKKEEGMLRVSTRGRYALRALVDVAQHSDEGPVLRRDVAARQEVSADYVAQLFAQLGAAGLVNGVKGRGGGYTLARDAATISARDVVWAVEGPIAVVNCTLAADEPLCHRKDRCITHLMWMRLSAAIAEFLDSVTLKDLCDEAQQLLQGQELGELEGLRGSD